MVDHELLDMLRKFYGKPPYNTLTNYCWYDGFYMRSIESQYSPKDIIEGTKIINSETD